MNDEGTVGQLDEPDADEPDAGETDAGETDAVLAWWKRPVNLISVAMAIAVLAGGIGFVVGNNRALPDPNRTDIGFLQDMRVHHEQAVQLSMILLADTSSEIRLRTIAREIVFGQSIEIGRMIQLLRDFGEPETSEGDLAMSWMSEPVPLERMPGLASQSEIDALVSSHGADKDAMFVLLISAHHMGGIHMAEYAADMAATDEVRLMAGQMAHSQQDEIGELSRLLDAISG